MITGIIFNDRTRPQYNGGIATLSGVSQGKITKFINPKGGISKGVINVKISAGGS